MSIFLLLHENRQAVNYGRGVIQMLSDCEFEIFKKEVWT